LRKVAAFEVTRRTNRRSVVVIELLESSNAFSDVNVGPSVVKVGVGITITITTSNMVRLGQPLSSRGKTIKGDRWRLGHSPTGDWLFVARVVLAPPCEYKLSRLAELIGEVTCACM
jgi:hypothetical protein